MTELDNDEELLAFLGDDEDDYNLGNEDEDALLADDTESISSKSVQKEQIEHTISDHNEIEIEESEDVLRISDYEEEQLYEDQDNSDGVTTTTNNNQPDDEDNEQHKRQSAKFLLERTGPVPKIDKIPDSLDQVITREPVRNFNTNRGGNQNRRPYNRPTKINELKSVHINPHFRGQGTFPNRSRANWDARQRLSNVTRNRNIPSLFQTPCALPVMNQVSQWYPNDVRPPPPMQQFAPPPQGYPPPFSPQQPPPMHAHAPHWNQYPNLQTNFNQIPTNRPPPPLPYQQQQQFIPQQNPYMGNQFAPPPFCPPSTSNNYPIVNQQLTQPAYSPPVIGVNFHNPPPIVKPVETYEFPQQLPPPFFMPPNKQECATAFVNPGGYGRMNANAIQNNRTGMVQRKKRYFEPNSNLQQVRTVDLPDTTSIENKNTNETANNDEDEETRTYRLQIEKQKRLREEILREKEARRAQAAKQNATTPTSTLPINSLQNIIKTSPLAPPPIKPKPTTTTPFFANRTVLVKDQSLTNTNMVVVSNLAITTSEIKLRKMSQGIGTIQKFQMSPKERQATITFNSVASAHAFFKKYQRTMLDLSMIKVTLKNCD